MLINGFCAKAEKFGGQAITAAALLDREFGFVYQSQVVPASGGKQTGVVI
jgi:hypothetical protein